jgi:hypothetical protein
MEISPFKSPRGSIVTGFSPEVNFLNAFFFLAGVDNPCHFSIGCNEKMNNKGGELDNTCHWNAYPVLAPCRLII